MSPIDPPAWTERPALHAAAVLLLTLAFFLVGNQSQLWDRDEPRYAEASRQMRVSGDAIVPMFNGRERFQKPPGIYWLQAASYAVFGVGEFGARFPSALFAALTCLLVFRFVWRRTARLRPAWLSVAALALSLMMMLQARAATTDATLLFLATLVMLEWVPLTGPQPRAGHYPRPHGMMVAVPEAERPRWWAWYTAAALAVLIKGPVIGAVFVPAAGLFFLANPGELPPLLRRLVRDWFTHLVGVLILATVVGGWVVAAQTATDGRFLDVFIGRDVLDRAASAAEGHGGPVIYYLPVLFLGFFPWLLLLGQTGRHTRVLDRRLVQWLGAWVIGPVVVFSLAATKLPHYIFPVFPALAVLTGVALDAAMREQARGGLPVVRMVPARDRWRTMLAVLAASVGCLMLIAPIVVAAVGLHALILPALALAVVLGGGSLLVARSMYRQDPRAATVQAAGALLLTGLIAAGPVALAFDTYKPGAGLGEALADLDSPPEGELLHCFGYDESSLTFYTHCVTYSHERESWKGDAFWRSLAADQRHFVLIRREPDEVPGARGLKAQAEGDLARFLLGQRQLRLLARLGPLFHYNQSRDRWFWLELYMLERRN